MSIAGKLSHGVSQALRALTGAGEAELVPQSRLSGPMPWVIAIMVALTGIALAAGLALRNTVLSAQAELEGGLTIQIVEAHEDLRDAQGEAAIKRLREMPEVVSIRLVPEEELAKLIEPWLGETGQSEDDVAVPVPALIDLQLKGKVNAALVAEVEAALADVAPAARVDAQSGWLEPVYDAVESLQWLALTLVLLLSMALAAAVLMASRNALGTNRDTIEIVHLLGGTDTQIARVFQRSVGVDALGGGVVGLALAVVVIMFLGRRFAGLGAGMVNGAALGLGDWVLLALVPVIATVLAMVTARLTVMHALRKML